MRSNPKFDTALALTVLFLLVFGLIMITSIGVPKSIALSAPNMEYPNCSADGVDCYLLFKKHLIRLMIGLVACYAAYRIPLKFWKKIAPVFYIGIVILLFSLPILGSSYGTIATNWIRVFNTSFQPSEFAKLAIIIYLARWFANKQEKAEDLKEGFLPFCLVSGLIMLPLIFQNDFGAVMVTGLIAVVIYVSAGALLKHLGIGLLVAFLLSIIVIITVPHVRERFQGFSRINQECLEDYCWQSQQANIAVATGGFWGKGLTQGVQKSYWLPQASDDFIFAASAEELGFIRIIFIVIAFYLLSLRGFAISNRAQNPFEMYLAIGITTWIVAQAFVNIAVNTALMPVTGITLPFVSYGGSSLIACLTGIGILLNISKNTNYYAGSINRRWDRGTRHPQHGRYRRA